MSSERGLPSWWDGGTPSSTSTSLLARAKSRDGDAWARLVKLYGPLVYQWCRQVGLQPNDAADVCQETLLAVASSLKNFRHDRPGSSFRGWLWTVTHSKIHDLFRRQQKQARAQGGTAAQERLQEIPEGSSDGSVTGSPEEDSGPEHRAIEFVRAAVEDRTWEAFWRVTVEGQRIADVAAELGMTEHAVYDAKYRVRRLVLRELRDLIA